MFPSKQSTKTHAKARQRRRLTAQERLERDCHQAQHAVKLLEQALHDLGLSDNLVAEIEGRLRSQQKLLSKIVGVMFPPSLAAVPTPNCAVCGAGIKTSPRVCWGRCPNTPGSSASAAWAWRCCYRYGVTPPAQVRPPRAAGNGRGWVMTRSSKSMASSWVWWALGGVAKNTECSQGLTGVLLVVVVGEGKLVVPVDFAIRRPDPTGPGGPCRDKLHWVQSMLDGRVAAFHRRGVELPPPMVVAYSWFSDSKLMRHVATTHQGTLLVEGKSTYTFALPDGRQVKGYDLQQPGNWPWRDSPQVPEMRYARLRATSPTYGAVTLIIVHEPGVALYYLLCLETDISGPRLIRAWKRRYWIEYCFRTLKHILATGACQVQGEDAYYGHLVLRLLGCLVLFYTSRVVCKGRLTM